MGRRSSREDILDAAERIIKRHGMASTTIEGVAAEAGITKGGVFYHFDSKKELFLQLVERYERHFVKLRQDIYDSLPEGPMRLLKSTVLACIRDPARKESHISNILTLLDDVEMRQRVFEMKLRIFEEVGRNSKCPEKAMIALLATDGLWITDMFGGEVIPKELLGKIVAELLRLIDEEDAEEKPEQPEARNGA